MHSSQHYARRGIMAGALNEFLCNTGTPPGEGVVANMFLTLPIFKHVFSWLGAHPAGALIIPPAVALAKIDMCPCCNIQLKGFTNKH